MIDELRALAVFAKTVECGSFRAAAQQLKLSPSVVSHHISRLEEKFGVALLYRSTRELSLTSEGRALFASARQMLDAAEEGFNQIARQSMEPVGSLRITISAAFVRDRLLAEIAAFSLAHPKIMLTINVSDFQQDLIRDGIDIAFRAGDMKDSALKSRKLFDIQRKLVVAPSVLARHRKPKTPADLQDWDWIGLTMRPMNKVLINARGNSHKIDYQPRIVTDSIEAVCQLAIAGLGLATPPLSMAEPALANGLLVEPLPGWRADDISIYMVWPPNAARESLTARLIAYLDAAFKRGR